MEKTPEDIYYEQTPEDEKESADSYYHESTHDETEFMKDMRHAAESANRLEIGASNFRDLSLRDKTVLSLIDIPEDYNPENNKDKNSIFVFEVEGVQYGKDTFAYRPDIQKAIHADFLEKRLKDKYFSRHLIKENEPLQEQLTKEKRIDYARIVRPILNNVLQLGEIDHAKLIKVKGLDEEEFEELIDIGKNLSQSELAKKYFREKINLGDETAAYSVHLKNAQYLNDINASTLSKQEVEKLNDEMEEKRQKVEVAKKLLETFKSYHESPDQKAIRQARELNTKLNISYAYNSDKDKFHLRKNYNVLINTPKDYRIYTHSFDVGEYINKEPLDLVSSIKEIQIFAENTGKQPEDEVIGLDKLNLVSGNISPNELADFMKANADIIQAFVSKMNSRFSSATAVLRDSMTRVIMAKEKKAREKDPNFEQFDDDQIKQLALETASIKSKIDNFNTAYTRANIINTIKKQLPQSYLDSFKDSPVNADLSDKIDNKTASVLRKLSRETYPSSTATKRNLNSKLKEFYGIENTRNEVEPFVLKNYKKLHNLIEDYSEDYKKHREQKQLFFKKEDGIASLKKSLSELGIEGDISDIDSTNPEKQNSPAARYLKKIIDYAGYIKALGSINDSEKRKILKKAQDASEIYILQKIFSIKRTYNTQTNPDYYQKQIDNLKQKADEDDGSAPKEEYLDPEFLTEKFHRFNELSAKFAINCIREAKSTDTKPKITIQADNTKTINDWISHYTQSQILPKVFAEAANDMGLGQDIKEVYFTPGYIFYADSEENYNISTFNTRLFDKIQDETTKNVLKENLNQPPFALKSETETAREYIKKYLELKKLKNEAVGANRDDQRKAKFRDEYNIEIVDGTLDSLRGTLIKETSSAELNALEKIAPIFGKFIAKATNSPESTNSNRINFYDNIAELHKQFICNETKYRNATIIFPSNRSYSEVNLTALANVMRSKTVTADKILQEIAYDAAIADYQNLNKDGIESFKKSLGKPLRPEPKTFMLLYQKLIANPTELLECTTRLNYCREFTKYCSGVASTPELKEFFDERARQIKPLE